MGEGEIVHGVLEITEVAEEILFVDGMLVSAGEMVKSHLRPSTSLICGIESVCEYLAHLADGFDFRWRSNCRAVGSIFLHWHARRGWVSDYEGRDHDEEKNACNGEHGNEIWI